jgi:hypothetical protein
VIDTVLHKQKAVKAISEAMKAYRGGEYVAPPPQVISSADYGKLTRGQIDQGVVAFLQACNMAAGSTVDYDLYKLLQAYLGDQVKRDGINGIMGV